MRRPWTKVVDVETERKAPAPGLKEKDEEEKSGMETREEVERLSEGGQSRHAAVTTGGQEPLWGLPAELPKGRAPDTQERRLGKGTSLDWGGGRVPGPRACKNAKGQHIPECPGKEEEKVKKGPECREPRL